MSQPYQQATHTRASAVRSTSLALVSHDKVGHYVARDIPDEEIRRLQDLKSPPVFLFRRATTRDEKLGGLLFLLGQAISQKSADAYSLVALRTVSGQTIVVVDSPKLVQIHLEPPDDGLRGRLITRLGPFPRADFQGTQAPAVLCAADPLGLLSAD